MEASEGLRESPPNALQTHLDATCRSLFGGARRRGCEGGGLGVLPLRVGLLVASTAVKILGFTAARWHS